MALFPLGKVVATRGALNALEKAEQRPYEFLAKHKKGDWGDVHEWDQRKNDASVTTGARILSKYVTSENDTIWILTEADRSKTTITIPSEY